jgi:hypothetical protein
MALNVVNFPFFQRKKLLKLILLVLIAKITLIFNQDPKINS